MSSLQKRKARIASRLSLGGVNIDVPEILLGPLERELKLWGTPFPPLEEAVPSTALTGSFKFALIVGHRKDRDGVYAPAPLSIGEWAFNNEIALSVEKFFHYNGDIQVKVFYRTPQGGSYSREIDDVYERADAWIGKLKGATAELHFNDLRTKNSPKNGVSGKETIYSGSSSGKKVAEIFHRNNSIQTKDRGLKIRTKGARGGRSVHVSKHPSVLLEPFDGRNDSDRVKAAEHGTDGFSQDIIKSITGTSGLLAT